jgi:hypothetical protein
MNLYISEEKTYGALRITKTERDPLSLKKCFVNAMGIITNIIAAAETM